GSTTSTCCSPTRATASPSPPTGSSSTPRPSASWPSTWAAASRSDAPRHSSDRSAAPGFTTFDWRSEHREVAAQLVLGDLAAVLLPLLALVAQEEVEDVLPQRLRDQLAVLHDLDGLVQVLGQRPDAERAALGGGQRPHVVLGSGGQLVVAFDTLQPR